MLCGILVLSLGGGSGGGSKNCIVNLIIQLGQLTVHAFPLTSFTPSLKFSLACRADNSISHVVAPPAFVVCSLQPLVLHVPPLILGP